MVESNIDKVPELAEPVFWLGVGIDEEANDWR